MKTVAVVPMKLNNRRLPQKNTRSFTNGKPLCSYILSTLLGVDGVDEIYVYCSNPDIQEFIPKGVKYLRRSETLDQDATKMNEVLRCFADDVPADIYLMTHTTAPFISKKSIEKGMYAVLGGDYDSAFAAKKLQDFLWKDGMPFNYELDNIPRTQDLPVLYEETSGFYIYRKEVMTKMNRRIGDKPYIVEVSEIESVDIDEAEDFMIADAIYNHILRGGVCKFNIVSFCCYAFLRSVHNRRSSIMKIIGVIPARYKSSRFSGKPLADICGKPMIWWVYQQCKKVKDLDEVYVATDDNKIFDVCQSLGMEAVMTSDTHKTGTDRVGEVARKIPADLIVNIQGDEPLLEPSTIRAAIAPFYTNPDLQVSNLMTRITNPVDVVNFTVPKVITNKDGIGVYLTRATAPYPKGSLEFVYYKQVCVYGFKPEALQFFCDYGMKYGKAKAEAVEDIEILRFIENGYKVQYIEVESDTIAVDTPNDLERVRVILEDKIKMEHMN